MRSILVSKDEQAFEENKWIWDGEFRFLDGESIEGNAVGISSFPRSGNSFLRRFVEQITGIATGSTISLHTSTTLQMQGFKGEYHTDRNVWVVRSHHPLYIKNSIKHPTNKTFIVVRHPLDVYPSAAGLFNTLNHGTKPDYEFYRDFPEWWDWFIRTNAV